MPWFLDRRSHQEFLAGFHGRNKQENHTEWDFEFRRELNRLDDLDYAIRRRIIQEPFKMEDENWRKRFDERLLARLASARWAELHSL
jgi:hypothetical protein